MKLHVSLATAVIGVATVVALWSARAGIAQEEQSDSAREERVTIEERHEVPLLPYHPEVPAHVRQKIKLHGGGGGGGGMFNVRFPAAPPHDAIRKAAEELRDAAGDEDQDEAREKLVGLLNEFYEEDMTRREQELKDIEARLEKLRAQLERRRDKKDEIIDLQVKVALNEAEGLGFYSGPHGGAPGGFNPVFITSPTPPTPPREPARAVKPARPARVGDALGLDPEPTPTSPDDRPR